MFFLIEMHLDNFSNAINTFNVVMWNNDNSQITN